DDRPDGRVDVPHAVRGAGRKLRLLAGRRARRARRLPVAGAARGLRPRTARRVRRPALLLGSLVAVVAGCGSGHRVLPCNRLPGRAVPILRDIHHIAYVDAPHVPYDSVPPTSGPHVPFVVAPGPYGSPIPEALQVHDLEHGHVLIQYAPRI